MGLAHHCYATPHLPPHAPVSEPFPKAQARIAPAARRAPATGPSTPPAPAGPAPPASSAAAAVAGVTASLTGRRRGCHLRQSQNPDPARRNRCRPAPPPVTGWQRAGPCGTRRRGGRDLSAGDLSAGVGWTGAAGPTRDVGRGSRAHLLHDCTALISAPDAFRSGATLGGKTTCANSSLACLMPDPSVAGTHYDAKSIGSASGGRRKERRSAGRAGRARPEATRWLSPPPYPNAHILRQQPTRSWVTSITGGAQQPPERVGAYSSVGDTRSQPFAKFRCDQGNTY